MKLTFFTGHDNLEELVLLENGSPVDPGSITRVTVQVGDVVLDSDTVPELFEWPVAGTWKGQDVDTLHLKLGDAGLPVGEHTDTRLTVYDPTYPDGIVWSEGFVVRVRS